MTKSRLYYGWLIVAVGFTSLVLAGGIGYYTFGAFLIPVSSDFGWSRAETSLAMTIAVLIGLLAPLVGTWVDRYGARRVMTIGAFVTGVAFALIGFTNSRWLFYVLYSLMAIGHLGSLDIPVVKVVSTWFDKRRGLAIGAVLSGFGVGGLAMLPLASFLIDLSGWRAAYHILGLAIVVVLTPLCAFVIKDRQPDATPADQSTRSEAETEASSTPGTQTTTGWTLSRTLRTKTFWLIVAALAATLIGTTAIQTHLVAMLQDRGVTHQMASTVLALVVGISVAGRLSAGYITDRLQIKYVAATSFLLQTTGLVLLVTTQSMSIVWLFVFIYGLGMGGLVAVMPLLLTTYFGIASLGAILGSLWAVLTLAAGAAPVIAGYIFDATGSYDLALVLFVVLTFVAVILALLLPASRGSRLTNGERLK